MLTQHNNSNREQRIGQQQVEKLATSLTLLWESKHQNDPPPSPRKLLFLMKHEIDFKHRHYEPCLTSRPITCFVTKFQTIFIIS